LQRADALAVRRPILVHSAGPAGFPLVSICRPDKPFVVLRVGVGLRPERGTIVPLFPVRLVADGGLSCASAVRAQAVDAAIEPVVECSLDRSNLDEVT
jgi:hypothetical protein